LDTVRCDCIWCKYRGGADSSSVQFLETLLDRAASTIEQLDANIWKVSHNVESIDLPVDFSDSLVWVARSTAGVQRADNLTLRYLNEVRRTGERESVLVFAMKNFHLWGFPRIVDGNVDDLRGGRVILVDASPSNLLRFGTIHKGAFSVLNGSRAMVVAMSRELFVFSATPIVLASENTLQQMSGDKRFEGLTSFILVKTGPNVDPRVVQQSLRERLPHHDVLLKNEWVNKTRMYWLLRTGLGLNMALNIGLGILVGLAVVSLNLYVVTMEHFREFGTIKAIGGRDSDIQLIIAIQGLVYGLVSFIVGWAVCRLIGVALKRVDLAPDLSPLAVIVALSFSLGLCFVASLVSFRRIAGIDPLDVMRS
jgi:putative ABC transport system permease protein